MRTYLHIIMVIINFVENSSDIDSLGYRQRHSQGWSLVRSKVGHTLPIYEPLLGYVGIQIPKEYLYIQ